MFTTQYATTQSKQTARDWERQINYERAIVCSIPERETTANAVCIDTCINCDPG